MSFRNPNKLKKKPIVKKATQQTKTANKTSPVKKPKNKND